MKTTLQKQLAAIAPHISIRTLWKHAPDCHDIREDVCDMGNENPNNWQCWQSEICALCVVDGEEKTGSDYLDGAWGKAGDVPEESRPDIFGYENQMTVEALKELQKQIDKSVEPDLHAQIQKAMTHCMEESRRAHAEQMKNAA